MAYNYDPTKPIYPAAQTYQAPELKDPGSALGETKGAESYIDPAKATVGGQVGSLLKEDSPLIQSAQANAMKSANSRGLINSSMAATGGTKAAIDSVMPIAQQDASTYASFGKTNQNTENQALLNTQAGQIDQNRAAGNAQITGALNEQNYGNEMSRTAFAGHIQSEIAKMQIDSAQKMSLASNISAQTNTLMSNIGSLLNNPDIEMNDNVTKWMSDFMYSGMGGIADLFGLEISVV